MKKYLILTLFSIYCLSLNAQLLFKKNKNSEIREKIENNLKYLVKQEGYEEIYFDINEEYITVYSSINHDEIEFTLLYDEIGTFLSLFDSLTYYEVLEEYLNKGNDAWVHRNEYIDNNEIKRIAIDPGHFAFDKKSSILESRYVKIKPDDGGEDLFINEANLNYQIAFVLSDMLNKEGYETIITRPENNSSLNIGFLDWVNNVDSVKTDINKMVDRNELTWGAATKIFNDYDTSRLFHDVYSFRDFKERARVINNFNPDFTIVIHLNALENSVRDEQGYSTLTDKNYYMGFIPGAFLIGELEKPDQRMDFLRLLVSNTIENSINISRSFSNHIIKDLGVMPYSQDIIESSMIEYSCIETPVEGMYSRNLYFSRAIESSLIYIEALLQSNSKEFYRLHDQSIVYNGMKVSPRCIEIAEAFYNSIIQQKTH